MNKKGRIVIDLDSPVLIRDPALNMETPATIRDWTNGLPYIPAGVIMQAIRRNADILRGVSKDKGARVDRVLGTADREGLLWLGHAFFHGISPTVAGSNQRLFQQDVYEAMTVEVQTWYGGRLVQGRAIRAGLVLEAPFQWIGEPKQTDYDCLMACCAGIRTIGEKTGEGLGCVRVTPDNSVLTKKNLDFLGG